MSKVLTNSAIFFIGFLFLLGVLNIIYLGTVSVFGFIAYAGL